MSNIQKGILVYDNIKIVYQCIKIEANCKN